MLLSIWLILLFLQPAFADQGRRGRGGVTDGDGEDEDVAVSATSPPSSGTSVAVPTTASSSFNSNGSSTYTSMYPSTTSPAPALRFSMPYNMTTCSPVTFHWQVIPPDSNVTNVDVRLLITNDGVHQSAPYKSSSPVMSTQQTRRQLPSTVISRDLSNKTALSLGSFSWSAVTVPQGWYILEASPATNYRSALSTQSSQFFVIGGSNTTCVYPHVSTSSSASSPSRSHLSPGALAGTIVGTIVGLAALLAAFALPRLFRRGVPGHQAWKEKRRGLYLLF